MQAPKSKLPTALRPPSSSSASQKPLADANFEAAPLALDNSSQVPALAPGSLLPEPNDSSRVSTSTRDSLLLEVDDSFRVIASARDSLLSEPDDTSRIQMPPNSSSLVMPEYPLCPMEKDPSRPSMVCSQRPSTDASSAAHGRGQSWLPTPTPVAS